MGLESVIDEFDHGLAEAQNDADLKNIANYLMDSPKAKVKFFEYLIGSYRDAHKNEYKEMPRKTPGSPCFQFFLWPVLRQLHAVRLQSRVRFSCHI